jgi:hypothetical protein
MHCLGCGSAAVTKRPERIAKGYRRIQCRTCGKQFNERAGGLLNRAQYPSNVIAFVVLWRLRCRLSADQDVGRNSRRAGRAGMQSRRFYRLLFVRDASSIPVTAASEFTREGHLGNFG